MSTFKIKNDKSKHQVQINTLDETHKKIMNMFELRRVSLPKKKKKLVALTNQLDILERTDPKLYTLDAIKKKSVLKTEIKELTDEIYDIENDVSELDYYSKTEDIIMDYYAITDNDDNNLYNEHPELCDQKINEPSVTGPDKLDILNMKTNQKKKQKKVTTRRKKKIVQTNQTNILNYFNINTEPEQVTETEEDFKSITESELDYSNDCNFNNSDHNDNDNNNTSNSNNDVNNEDGIFKIKNKAELLDQYMMLVDSEYVSDKKRSDGKIRKCLNCDVEKTLIHSEGIFVCQCCGEAESVIIDSEKPNYKEATTDTKPGYPYKRINHYNEWLESLTTIVDTSILVC